MEHIAGMVIFPGQLAFMEGLGGPEMMLIFVVILMMFGGQKLPEFARGLGKSIREFKKAAAGVEDEFKRAMDEDERKKSIAALAEEVRRADRLGIPWVVAHPGAAGEQPVDVFYQPVTLQGTTSRRSEQPSVGH